MIDNEQTTTTGGDSALQSILESVRRRNPFVENRTSTTGKSESDVEGIHQRAFERLERLASETLREGQGLGAVVWGEAGIGKSHLLGRLSRWAKENAFLVYLPNLQAAPHALPRSLLRSVVSQLTWSPEQRFTKCVLFETIRQGLLEYSQPEGRVQSWDRLQRSFQAWLNRPNTSNSLDTPWIDHTICHVLFEFFRSAYRSAQGKETGRSAELASRWLAGQALDAEDARQLQLPPALHENEPVGLEDDQEIKEVLVVLSRLMGLCNKPFVLAFDQVDNLDEDQFASMSRFLEALADSSPNLLVVIAGIQASLLQWREAKVIQDSAWDRLAHTTIQLQRISSEEAERIVLSRLESFWADAGSATLDRLRSDDPLFPLGRGWAKRHLAGKSDVRPRDVVNWARAGWREEQDRLDAMPTTWLDDWASRQDSGPQETVAPKPPRESTPLLDDYLSRKLSDHVREWSAKPQALPADGERLAGLLYHLLLDCVGDEVGYRVERVKRVQPPRSTARPIYDIDMTQSDDDGSLRTGVLVLTADSATSVAGFLRRLRENADPLQRVVLVTDERVGLPLGDKGEEYLQELEQSDSVRFETLEVSFREYVELDAIRSVIDSARSGDLELETAVGKPEAIAPADVLESLRRQDRYRSHRVLRELLLLSAKGDETLFEQEDTSLFDLPSGE